VQRHINRREISEKEQGRSGFCLVRVSAVRVVRDDKQIHLMLGRGVNRGRSKS
jgi:hypothetical protein